MDRGQTDLDFGGDLIAIRMKDCFGSYIEQIASAALR